MYRDIFLRMTIKSVRSKKKKYSSEYLIELKSEY